MSNNFTGLLFGHIPYSTTRAELSQRNRVMQRVFATLFNCY